MIAFHAPWCRCAFRHPSSLVSVSLCSRVVATMSSPNANMTVTDQYPDQSMRRENIRKDFSISRLYGTKILPMEVSDDGKLLPSSMTVIRHPLFNNRHYRSLVVCYRNRMAKDGYDDESAGAIHLVATDGSTPIINIRPVLLGGCYPPVYFNFKLKVSSPTCLHFQRKPFPPPECISNGFSAHEKKPLRAW